MDFAKCKAEGCDPVFQVRGEMGEGDYFGVISGGSITSAEPVGSPAIDHYKFVELNDNNKDDIRIICRKCFLATPWGTANVPNMPGVGRSYCYEQWAIACATRDRKSEMLKALEDKFGKDDVKKFFKHSL